MFSYALNLLSVHSLWNMKRETPLNMRKDKENNFASAIEETMATYLARLPSSSSPLASVLSWLGNCLPELLKEMHKCLRGLSTFKYVHWCVGQNMEERIYNTMRKNTHLSHVEFLSSLLGDLKDFNNLCSESGERPSPILAPSLSLSPSDLRSWSLRQYWL